MQKLFNRRQDPGDDQNGQDRALVASLGNIDTKDIPVGHLAIINGLSNVIATDQIWHDHGHGHARAEEFITSKALSSSKAHEDRKEGKRSGCQEVD